VEKTGESEEGENRRKGTVSGVGPSVQELVGYGRCVVHAFRAWASG